MAAAANSSSLIAEDATGLKDLSTEGFVKAYSKHVSGALRAGGAPQPGGFKRARCACAAVRRAPQRARN